MFGEIGVRILRQAQDERINILVNNEATIYFANPSVEACRALKTRISVVGEVLRRSGRVIAHEFMDLGPEYYSEQEYFDMLYKLGTINKLLGGDRATFSAIKKLNSIPESILDVGCGAGRSTNELAQKFPQARVVGIDIEQPIINYAQSVFYLKNEKVGKN